VLSPVGVDGRDGLPALGTPELHVEPEVGSPGDEVPVVEESAMICQQSPSDAMLAQLNLPIGMRRQLVFPGLNLIDFIVILPDSDLYRFAQASFTMQNSIWEKLDRLEKDNREMLEAVKQLESSIRASQSNSSHLSTAAGG
jgi:hypothetical protein